MTTKGKGFEPKGGRARRAAERELNEFLDDWRERVLPNIEQSAAVLVIAPEDKHADLKIAIEVGMAILLEKPLIVFKPKDRDAAPRLLTIADLVIEGDIKTDGDRITDEIGKFFKERTKGSVQ